ncbi:hypothetical protein DPV78_005054 [Talaromyces pinophilus]|nr:hypothetical protein DPV78_005054 [Talaromyces pinophilus]
MTSLFSSSVFAEPTFTVYNSTDCPSDGIIPQYIQEGCTPVTEGFWSISFQFGLGGPANCSAAVWTGLSCGEGTRLATFTENDKCYNLDAAAHGVGSSC